MRDSERISRLLGAVLNECSGREMEGVRTYVLKAINALDSVSTKKRPAIQQPYSTIRTLVRMTKEQRDRALDDIQRMIDEEGKKIKGEEAGGETIFG